jgi:hypothetical protein
MTEYTWNHRLMNCPSENGGDDYYCFVEVHYEDGEPVGYTDAFMGGETVDEVRELVTRLYGALGTPVLHEDEFGDDND